MTKPTDKQRADAAEAKLAELVIRNFDQTYREIIADNDMQACKRFAKLFRALADVLDSGVPMSVVGPLLERVLQTPHGSAAAAPSPQGPQP